MTLKRLGRLNELTSRKSAKTSVTSRKIIGLTITDTREISNEFNDHFSTIGPKLASDIDSDSGDYQRYLTRTDKRFHLHPTDARKVFSLMNKLNKSKATAWTECLRRLFEGVQISFVCPYAIFFSNLLVRVNSQKTGNRLELHPFSSKEIEMT